MKEDDRSCREIAEDPAYKARIAEEHRLMDERLGLTSSIGNPKLLPVEPKVPRVTRRFDPVTRQTFICSDAGLDPRLNDGNHLPPDELMERLQRALLK